MMRKWGGVESEEAEEEGRWEGRGNTMTKGRHTGRSNNKQLPPPPPELAAAAEPSDSDPAILFTFREKEAVATAVDTPSSRSPFSSGIIASSSRDRPPRPHPRPSVIVPMKTRQNWGWIDSSWYRMGRAGEEKVKEGEAPSRRIRGEVGRGGGKFLLQLFVRIQFGGKR